jgi:hypothetical protein
MIFFSLQRPASDDERENTNGESERVDRKSPSEGGDELEGPSIDVNDPTLMTLDASSPDEKALTHFAQMIGTACLGR